MNLKHMHVNKLEHVNFEYPNGWTDTTNFSCSIYERYFALAVNLLANIALVTLFIRRKTAFMFCLCVLMYVYYVLLQMLH